MLGSSGKGMLICLFFFVQLPTWGCTVRGLKYTHTRPGDSSTSTMVCFTLPTQEAVFTYKWMHTCTKANNNPSPQRSIYVNKQGSNIYLYVCLNLRGSKLFKSRLHQCHHIQICFSLLFVVCILGYRP